MRNPKRSRPLLAMTMGLLALVVTAPPVAATEVRNQGDTGFYTIYDEEGNTSVTCRYKADGDFDRVSIAPPIAHSSDSLPESTKQWIGWRVVVDRRTPGGGSFAPYFRTGFQKRQATGLTVGDFDPRSIDLPSTNHQWRVRTIIRYYAVGTTTDVVGTVEYRYDWYKRRKAGTPGSNEAPDYCIPHF